MKGSNTNHDGIGLAANKDQIEDEISRLKQEVKVLAERTEKPVTAPSGSSSASVPEGSVNAMLLKLLEERERTNRVLGGLMDKIERLEQQFHSAFEAPESEAPVAVQPGMVEVLVSHLDGTILDLVRTKGMICADDLKTYMNYRGRNAACSRLNALCRLGFLQKQQLGHKVYYRIDAGKATKALIISPPQ